MKPLLITATILAISFFILTRNAQAAEILSIVPGKSLGSISIDEKRESLLNKCFAPSGAHDPEMYLRKDDIVVKLDSNKVSEIFFDSSSYKNLRLRGKKFPKDTRAKAMRKFFKKCGPSVKSSGGTLIYCENRGIELSYSSEPSSKKRLIGLAIVTPALVESMLNPPPEK
jgi:hypothetical protein